MNLRPRHREDPEINLISMIDVLLVLLIFFMVSTTFNQEGRVKVQLPQSSDTPIPRGSHEPLVITVTVEGTYRVNERTLINASADTLRRLQLGLDNIALPQRSDPASADPSITETFRKAFIKLKDEHGLYRQEANGVTFLTPALFQTSIALPAEVPTGNYEIDVKLFLDGMMIARTPSALEIYKAGFEQFVSSSAQNHGLLYGLAASGMAILTGWFASVVFRRD